jgi:hypothetical protein
MTAIRFPVQRATGGVAFALTRFGLVGLALAGLTISPTPVTAQIITERAPTSAPTIMSDATPPVVAPSPILQGIGLTWQPVTGASGYTICRESPPGSSCIALTPSQLPATTTRYYDVNLPPGGTHGYSVAAWRPDGHYGVARVTATVSVVPTPMNFVVKYDSSNAATPVVILGWNGMSYHKADGQQAPASYRISGTGMSPQVVTGNSYRVVLGSGEHNWSLTAMVPNGTGGWFESATPSTTKFTALVKYRLVALGFKVLTEATDPPIDPNGSGNEVYASTGVNVTTTAFAAPFAYTLRSATFGEVGNNAKQFPGRIRAGSMGRNGGLTAGDMVPTGLNLGGATAPISATTTTDQKAATSTGASAFPLLVWEGRLASTGMIVVHPTLWEEDPDHSFHSNWTRQVESIANRAYSVTGYDPGAITRLRDNAQVGPGVNASTLFTCQDDLLIPAQYGQCLANGQDRPLGLQGNPQGWAGWFDHVLVLTPASIEASLRGVGTRPGTSPGTIVVPLSDTGKEAKASYELYLRVERVP